MSPAMASIANTIAFLLITLTLVGMIRLRYWADPIQRSYLFVAISALALGCVGLSRRVGLSPETSTDIAAVAWLIAIPAWGYVLVAKWREVHR